MNVDTQIYKCNPRQVREFLIDCIKAGLVPFIHGSPGIGKSTIVRGVSDEFKLEMIDHRLSTSAPEDLSGLPHFFENQVGEQKATFVPFDIFPTTKTILPTGKHGWMLFLDEANAAVKTVQAASYKLVLDRMVGQSMLNERVAVVMAGNLTTDRSIVNALSTAMQSRIVHLEMEVNFQHWLEDVAWPKGYDERIIAFLSYKPEYLMDFRPDHDDKTFSCPRTWEFVQRLLAAGVDTSIDKTPLFSGTITSGVAVSFIQFCAVRDDMPDRKAILRDPMAVPVPDKTATRWMVISHLSEHVNDETFEKFAIYANRFPIEIRILFYRSTISRHPRLQQHPIFASSMGELSRYLNG